MFCYYNANPSAARVGDCTIRAISKATNKSWEETYIKVALKGLMMYDMPSANHVWGAYLEDIGFTRHIIPENCSVRQFADEHPTGAYILAISGHVVACVDGTYFDTFDSGDCVPIYYWEEN